MPNFPGPANGTTPVLSNASPIALHKGESVYLFGVLSASATQLPVNDSNVTFETPAASPQASIAVCLVGAEEGSPPPMVTVEVLTNGAPGAGETIAIQEADTHADAFFITPIAAAYTITSFNANNAARSDLSPTGGKYLRVLRTKGANAVGATVKVTRLA